MEIERKFTVKEIPSDLSSYFCEEIEQAYLSRNPVVRVRRLNDSYILTIKQKIKKGKDGGPIVNREEEFEMERDAFLHLLSKADGNVIIKKRYLIPLPEECKGIYAGSGRQLVAELDIFSGYLQGLRFAEVEFEGEKEAAAFVPPAWFDRDVSSDPNYSNGHLSQKKS